FTGSAAKAAGTGTQQIGNAPGTGLRWVQMLEPAGGWTFKCTAAPSSPETVYGWVLTDGAGTTTWFSALLPDPVVIADVGDTVAIPGARVPYVAPVLNKRALSATIGKQSPKELDPMAVVRTTFFFKSASATGWTETFFNLSSSLTTVQLRARNLAALRAAMLSADNKLAAFRVSDDEVFRDAIFEVSNL